MSTTQELFAMLITAIILCFVFARVYKSEKLFSKLVITLILGFILGLGYSIVKSELAKPDVVTANITKVSNTYDLNSELWINFNPMYDLSTSVVEKVLEAIPDYTSKGRVNSESLNDESKSFKLRQLKIRCRSGTG